MKQLLDKQNLEHILRLTIVCIFFSTSFSNTATATQILSISYACLRNAGSQTVRRCKARPLGELQGNKDCILILVSPLMGQPINSFNRREEYTTQKLRTSSPNKAQPIIIKGRPISDGTTGDEASCFLSSSKSVTSPTSGSQLPVFSSYLLSAVTSHPRLFTRMDFCFCFLYHFSENRNM